MTPEVRESFIGVFEAPEITRELDAALTGLRGIEDAATGIVTSALSSFWTSLRFRNGVHKALIFIFDAPPARNESPLSGIPNRAYSAISPVPCKPRIFGNK
jgi:hypothetical protein